MRVDEHTISLEQAPVLYRSAPASGAPALYLHGVPTSSEDWVGFLERTGGFAPDLIGFGRSAKGGNLDYTIDGLADFVQWFLKTLEIERIKLVAHDWGAAAGLAFAQREPERVERIVLINALPLLPGFRWPALARLWRRPGLGELLMGSTPRWMLARMLRHGCVRSDAWSAEQVSRIWEQFDQGTQRAILRLHRDASENRLAEAGAQLGTLTAPTLVLWGEHDPWLAPELGAGYAARLPNAELERLPEAGHWPWLDRPELIDRVADFLGSP